MVVCLLCGSGVEDLHPVCPYCGGALDRHPPGPDGSVVSLDKPAEVADLPGGWAPSDGPPRPAGWGPPAGFPAPVPGGPGFPSGPFPAPGAPPNVAGFPAYQGPPPGYSGYPGGWPPPPGYGGWAAPRPYEPLAVASLVTSIVALVLGGACLLPFLAAPVGAVMGHVAMRKIAHSGHQGRGLALAGVIIGWIVTALVVGFVCLWMVAVLISA